MMSIQERIDRIQDQTKIVRLEDMTIHEVSAVTHIGEAIIVTTTGGFQFLDIDVFTLDEICNAERAINKIKLTL
jgi:hypothetical protein